MSELGYLLSANFRVLQALLIIKHMELKSPQIKKMLFIMPLGLYLRVEITMKRI
jgi:hypothetical protein